MATVLGVDVGGSGIKGALVDVEKGKMVSERFRLDTPEKGKPQDMAEVFKKIVDHFTWTGIVGCGFPAIIRHGVALSAANIAESWVNTDVNALFSKASGCKVFTVNDADAAGVAEMRFGAGRNQKDGVVLLLTLGTGIGSAYFIEGKLFPNTELGHMQLRGKDAEKRASDAIRKKKDWTWKEWAQHLQEFLDTVEFLLPPDLIIIGGGVSKESEKFLPYIKTRARLVPAELQNQAGIIGAAMYAVEQK
jgi:polyphosphate glucokinase